MKSEMIYDSLLITGLAPGTEEAVKRYTERKGLHPLIFRCEEGRIWDPYGSLARSVVSALVRYPTIRSVWVLGLAEEEGQPLRLDAHSAVSVGTLQYLLKHHLGLDPTEWLQVRPDSLNQLSATTQLLHRHALLSPRVEIHAGLLQSDGFLATRCDRLP